jgi:hypothetical protein
VPHNIVGHKRWLYSCAHLALTGLVPSPLVEKAAWDSLIAENWLLNGRHEPGVKLPSTRPPAKTVATATLAAPGEYILRAQANDVSSEGGGGFQCCWTNVHVKVVVRER